MNELAHKYGQANLPRYTSYPTAPHFSDQVTPQTYRSWLGHLTSDQSLSLYLHVPFCEKMCWYCGCFTKISRGYEPISRYVDALLAEIDIVARAIGNPGLVRHIHWGGGSPNRLLSQDFAKIMRAIERAFPMADACEIAVEIDPRSYKPGDAELYAQTGVTRVSLGVQTFEAQVQIAVNRVQPFSMIASVVEELRAAGIDQINFDLMYGLPYQTATGVEETVRLAISLAPNRIATFAYAHVPWMKKHQRMIEKSALPGTQERLQQARTMEKLLEDHGYNAIGLDHYALAGDPLTVAAKTGRLRRNFQGYTTDPADALIGFGASAIGEPMAGYVQNTSDLAAYNRAMAQGRLATVRGFAATPRDRLHRAVIEKIMCAEEVDVAKLCLHYGQPLDALDENMRQLGRLAADGLVGCAARRVWVRRKGWPFLRVIAACFDAYLAAGQARHSRAV
ncbi:MAG: oxygen-independent coproporphyrinogen III oxidase [Alphaproteobacteria bacterium]